MGYGGEKSLVDVVFIVPAGIRNDSDQIGAGVAQLRKIAALVAGRSVRILRPGLQEQALKFGNGRALDRYLGIAPAVPQIGFA